VLTYGINSNSRRVYVLLSPIILNPIFAFSKVAVVYSIEADDKVTIYSGNQKTVDNKSISTWDKIGTATSTGGAVNVWLDRPLKKDEYLTAVVDRKKQSSNPASPVQVQELISPISAPICLDTLYVGSKGIYAWGMIPGSKVSIFSNGNELLGEEIAVRGDAQVFLNRPLKSSDSITLIAAMVDAVGTQPGSTLIGITPIMPHGSGVYAEKLPPPTVIGPLYDGYNIVGLRGLLPGARFWVYADREDNIIFDNIARRLSDPVLIGSFLKEGQRVFARQAFESINMISDPGNAELVKKIPFVPPPYIEDNVYEGDTIIFIDNLLCPVEVQIEIYTLNSSTLQKKTILIESLHYTGGFNQFDFGLELQENWIIIAKQIFNGLDSPLSNKVVVKKKTEKPKPPVVHDPLYAFSNIVPVDVREDDAWETVFADKIMIGEKKGKVVRVTPHLQENQGITAIQAVGKNNSSDPSHPPIKVWGIGDAIKPPTLWYFDACLPYCGVSDLLVGAQVNVFWEPNLLIASGDAVDGFIVLPFSIQPWPGAKIVARQSLGGIKSANSNEAYGFLNLNFSSITKTTEQNKELLGEGEIKWGRIYCNDLLIVKVATSCPVRENLAVTINSSNNYLKVHGLPTNNIGANESETIFMLEALAPGKANILLSTDKSYIANSSIPVTVFGKTTIDPSYQFILDDETFVVEITLDPKPQNGKFTVGSQMGRIQILDSQDHPVASPAEFFISIAEKNAKVTCKPLPIIDNSLQPIVEREDTVYATGDCYDTASCNVTIRKRWQPAP
jgi:hypothetical protein